MDFLSALLLHQTLWLFSACPAFGEPVNTTVVQNLAFTLSSKLPLSTQKCDWTTADNERILLNADSSEEHLENRPASWTASWADPNDSKCRLTVNKAATLDHGKWALRIEGNDVSETFFVSVQGAPKFVSPPKFAEGNVNYDLGSSVSTKTENVTCQIDGVRPAAEFRWLMAALGNEQREVMANISVRGPPASDDYDVVLSETEPKLGQEFVLGVVFKSNPAPLYINWNIYDLSYPLQGGNLSIAAKSSEFVSGRYRTQISHEGTANKYRSTLTISELQESDVDVPFILMVENALGSSNFTATITNVKGGLSGWAIFGIVFGCAVVVVIIGLLIYLVMKKRRSKKRKLNKKKARESATEIPADGFDEVK
eukprot:maker-scaffold1298_size49789-snap-gene-0.12 protein:Tk10581 transcript:maker-scaffold1298_size49789-snap-gene-0.12-mRNA-1 annotation:"hypothetical protein DAPPUDRAFT_54063"